MEATKKRDMFRLGLTLFSNKVRTNANTKYYRVSMGRDGGKVLIIEQILHSFQEGHPNDGDGQQAELAAAGNRQLDWSEPWLGNK